MSSCVHLLKITNLQLDCLSHSLHQPLNGILAACSPQVAVMPHFLGIFSKQLPELMQIFSVELTTGFWIAANIVIQLGVFWVFVRFLGGFFVFVFVFGFGFFTKQSSLK